MIDSGQVLLMVLGLTAVSAVNRSFFFLSRRQLPLPAAFERGLRYAPVGALFAVVAPEVLLDGSGHLRAPLDAHLLSAASATAYAALRRRDMLGTILVGMGVFLGLHLGLGW